MKEYSLYREQFIPSSLDTVWEFFSTPANLAKITPKEMSFVVLTDLSGEPIYPGMQIEYVVKPIFGIPVKWVTEIGEVKEQRQFVDTQLKGPYAMWEHTHIFEEAKGGVLMKDSVRYALPFGVLGTLTHTVLVKKKLEDIFNFRAEAIKQFFS